MNARVTTIPLPGLAEGALAHRHLRAAARLSLTRPPRAFASTESRRGPGWFESSWELRSGLDVREGLPADARLDEWIGACLSST